MKNVYFIFQNKKDKKEKQYSQVWIVFATKWKEWNVDDISMWKKIIDIFLVSSDIIGKINE